MAAWICPTCRIHYGETQAGICPADGTRLVMNLSGAQLLGNTLTHLLQVGPDGSTVWEAATPQGARVAMKLLRGPQDATAWSTAALMSHPRIIALRGYASIDDDLACVVMQWLDGRSLTETLADGALPLPRALALMDELLDALEYVHSRDVVHGDLHADNVFLERGEHVKLVDVGVRKVKPLAEILGVGRRPLDWYTVLYAPPERLATGRQDARGDLYAAGALLWHMCTGAPPFGIDPQSVARHHLTAPRPRLAEARPDVAWPPGLSAIIERAMALRPEARFPSAGALRTALQQLKGPRDAAELPLPSPAVTSPAGTTEPAEPASGRTAGLAVAGAAVLVGGALMWALARTDPPRPSPGLAGGAAGAPATVIHAAPTLPPPPLVAEVVRAKPLLDAAPPPPPDAGAPDAAALAAAPLDAAPADTAPPIALADAAAPDAAVAPPTAPPDAAAAPPSIAAAKAVPADEPRAARPSRGGSTEVPPRRRTPRTERRITILGAEEAADGHRPARIPLLDR